MKRFHVHVSVEKLDDSIRFYSSLFGTGPDRGAARLREMDAGRSAHQFCHLAAGTPARRSITWGFRWRAMTNCTPCAANWRRRTRACWSKQAQHVAMPVSDKYWVTDPQGVAWETFHTLDSVPVYGEDTRAAAMQSACCIPLAPAESEEKAGACCIPLTASCRLAL